MCKRMRREIRKYFKLNDNEYTAYSKSGEAAKTLLSGKFMTLNTYTRKEERSKIHYLKFYLKKPEKEEQGKRLLDTPVLTRMGWDRSGRQENCPLSPPPPSSISSKGD